MTITVHDDLARYIRQMADCNGISIEGFANDLIEKGIKADLELAHTEESASRFMCELRSEHECNWAALKANDEITRTNEERP
ncbi:MAG: hypothetical protein HYX68_14125 [Planctomycetes bacterium]|nr:hypothetical protein [Planctomycetota bacterium]